MAYTKRLQAPSKSNKYYYSDNPFYKAGYGLPNCTCYAWGRFYEISGTRPKLSTSNAENWWGHNDGYKRGKTPQLGAVICWSKGRVGVGSDGAGHVGIVEKIYDDGSILVGQSGWRASRVFWTTKVSKGYALSGYKFQGFIYNPAVTEKYVPAKPKKLELDGDWGKKTTKLSQYVLKTEEDGFISNQPASNKKYLPNANTDSWIFKTSNYSRGSDLVEAIQKHIGMPEKSIDRFFGKLSAKYMQKFLKKKGFYTKKIIGIRKLDKATVIAWQKYLNSKI